MERVTKSRMGWEYEKNSLRNIYIYIYIYIILNSILVIIGKDKIGMVKVEKAKGKKN